MQQEKRKQKRSKQPKNAPRDFLAIAEEYNKEYHSLVKTEDEIHKKFLEYTISLSEENSRPAKVSELIGYSGFVHLLSWTYSKRVETRCVIDENLIEETWEMIKGISKRVHTKADIEKLAAMELRLANMRKEDASLNEKFDRIEPVMDSFEQFLADKGLEPKDLLKQKDTTHT